MSLLTPIIQVYNYTLQPVAPFTWFNLPISTLDAVAAFRLCIVLRQIKESLYQQHVSKNSAAAVAPKSFARDAATTLTVVYGGEVMTGAWRHFVTAPSRLIATQRRYCVSPRLSWCQAWCQFSTPSCNLL
jgi:hypothetical protein